MNKNILIIGAVVVVVALGAVVVLKKPKTGENMMEQKSTFEIKIQDSAYTPAVLTVKAGEKIKVTNFDIQGHSATADDGSFDTGVLAQNQEAMITAPNKPGTYTFHCVPHPSIKGTLIVE